MTAGPAAPPPKRRAAALALPLLLAACAAGWLLWPGDAPWINDEPKLIQLALHFRETGQIPSSGLLGSRGIPYGPFGVWAYATLLLFTDDIVTLVALRAFLFALLCGVSIVWIARLCPRLLPAAGALAFLSPYLWIYSRQLWDNTFLIPLSGITAAAYLSFCARREAWKLWIVATGCAFMSLTHLISAAPIAAVALHALWAHRRWLFSRPGHVAGILAAGLLLCGPYAVRLSSVFGSSAEVGGLSPWRGWFFPLLGGRIFSAWGLDYFFGEGWPGGPMGLAASATWIALPLVWAGIALSARRVAAAFRDPAARDPDFHMALLGLMTIGLQSLLYGLLRAYGHPHYLGPAWIFSFYFLWTALSEAGRRWRQVTLALPCAYGLALALVTVSTAWDIHRSGGNRGIHYGPTLGGQIEIARAIGRHSPGSPVSSDALHYRLFPHALMSLRYFYGLNGTQGGPLRRLTIGYREPGGDSGWLVLEESD